MACSTTRIRENVRLFCVVSIAFYFDVAGSASTKLNIGSIRVDDLNRASDYVQARRLAQY